MNRYKLTIEYDGKNFNGWQKQKNMKTVQGIIEESLFKFSGKKITCIYKVLRKVNRYFQQNSKFC